MIAINPAGVQVSSADPKDSCKLPQVNYRAAYTFNKTFHPSRQSRSSKMMGETGVLKG